VDAEEPILGPYLGDGSFPPAYPPGDQDLRLRPGSVAEDAGVWLANIDDFYTGAGPDLGPYEIGMPLPVYGPAGSVPSSVEPAPVEVAPQLAAFPNPFRHSVRFGLEGAAHPDVVQIFAADGRRVRTLRSEEAGSAPPSWDGRDETGRRVASGTYWIRAQSPHGQAASGRVILLP
jgi:hypothetical protein